MAKIVKQSVKKFPHRVLSKYLNLRQVNTITTLSMWEHTSQKVEIKKEV